MSLAAELLHVGQLVRELSAGAFVTGHKAVSISVNTQLLIKAIISAGCFLFYFI